MKTYNILVFAFTQIMQYKITADRFDVIDGIYCFYGVDSKICFTSPGQYTIVEKITKLESKEDN